MNYQRLSFFRYSEQRCDVVREATLQQAFPLPEGTCTWIAVGRPLTLDEVEYLESQQGIHPLVLEDIASLNQRAKVEEHGDYSYLVLRLVEFFGEKMRDKQVSLLLGPRFLISFVDRGEEFFHEVEERLIQGRGKVRKMGVDYLAYQLIDAIVDHYFVVLENLGNSINHLETICLQGVEERKFLPEVNRLRHEMVLLKRAIWPLRETIGTIQRREVSWIQEQTLPYFKDIYDHTIQIVESLDTFRETVAGLMNIYLSSVTNKMNEVIKILTIVSTIFVPLTFVVGVYGMNFDYIPELHMRWAYYAVWAVMGCIALLMLLFFRKKRWL